MYDFSVMPRYRFHRLDKIHFEYMAIGSICVYDLSVSIRYACGTFIIFSMRCTLSLSLYISVCAVLCCAVMCSRRPSTHLSYVLFVVRSFSVVCAMMSVCFTSIFEFGMCDRTESPSIRLSNLIERRFCDTKMFLLILLTVERRGKNNNTTYTHQSSFFSFSFNTLLFYLFNSFFWFCAFCEHRVATHKIQESKCRRLIRVHINRWSLKLSNSF